MMRLQIVGLCVVLLSAAAHAGDYADARQAIPVPIVFEFSDGSAAPAATPWHHTNRPPPTGNGRLWQDSVFFREPTPVVQRSGRGPAHFGAAQDDPGVLVLCYGHAMFAISAWDRSGQSALGHMDRARSDWLRDRGLVGGVRTFVNPRAAESGQERTHRSENSDRSPEPAGRFRRPADVPRTRPVEQVRYSLPPGTKPTTAAALASQHLHIALNRRPRDD